METPVCVCVCVVCVSDVLAFAIGASTLSNVKHTTHLHVLDDGVATLLCAAPSEQFLQMADGLWPGFL
ncbi:MAG: hypothetical protein ACPIOQ_41460, partial [Promethearchaeia archaeon]